MDFNNLSLKYLQRSSRYRYEWSFLEISTTTVELWILINDLEISTATLSLLILNILLRNIYHDPRVIDLYNPS